MANLRVDILQGLSNYDPNKADKKKLTQLTQLATYVDSLTDQMELADFIHKLGKDKSINELDSYGRAALHWIVGQNYDTGVDVLIQHGAKTNVKTQKEGFTPLMVSCRKEGSCKITKQLLMNNASYAMKAKNSATAFHIAVASGSHNCMRLLVLHGADPYLPLKDGRTALDLACDEKTKKLVYSCYRSSTSRKEKKDAVCAECEAKDVHLSRCGNCYCTFYCSPTCQLGHWKTGHAESCPGNSIVKKDNSVNADDSVNNEKAFLVQITRTKSSDLIVKSKERNVHAKITDEKLKQKFSEYSPRGTPWYHWAKFVDSSQTTLYLYHGKIAPVPQY